jgi:hypothetical protein
MFTETISGKDGRTDVQTHYYFSGHDTKIIVDTTCHGEASAQYTPLFEDAVKSLVQE